MEGLNPAAAQLSGPQPQRLVRGGQVVQAILVPSQPVSWSRTPTLPASSNVELRHKGRQPCASSNCAVPKSGSRITCGSHQRGTNGRTNLCAKAASEPSAMVSRVSTSNLASCSTEAGQGDHTAVARPEPAESDRTVCGSNAFVSTHVLPPSSSLYRAVEAIDNFLRDCTLLGVPQGQHSEADTSMDQESVLERGVLRIETSLPPGQDALSWLRRQPQIEELLPRVYFSPRHDPYTEHGDTLGSEELAVAGAGSAMLWKGEGSLEEEELSSLAGYLSEKHDRVCIFGGERFDASGSQSSGEWANFGGYYFVLPRLELRQYRNRSLLSCTLAWSGNKDSVATAFQQDVELARRALGLTEADTRAKSSHVVASMRVVDEAPQRPTWTKTIESLLEQMQSQTELSKVVLARSVVLESSETVEALSLLAKLQEKDPSAYQFCLQLPTGEAFIGSTPERLFSRKGRNVWSEAVAGTRPRGHSAREDDEYSSQLMQSPKEQVEFSIVFKSVLHALEAVCQEVSVEAENQLLKQTSVQHLYGRVKGVLRDEISDAGVLRLLHATPAVCGQPKRTARDMIRKHESFDRGFYAGPFGWLSGNAAEFCVAIRSALVTDIDSRTPRESWSSGDSGGSRMCVYAGVGIVPGAEPDHEWDESCLKMKPILSQVRGFQSLSNFVNMNELLASLAIEELCRLGVTYFCVAPGSRSSPLSVAVASNPRANYVICLDERSLAHHAVGYGKSGRPAAIITSSGSAVSNLYPAVTEASQSHVPVILLTADRPPELLDTGANQAIDQVKIFGDSVRWFSNIPPPDDSMEARVLLTTLSYAVQEACSSSRPGPVHLNIQFREPLAPISQEWSKKCLVGLQKWTTTGAPYVQYISDAGLVRPKYEDSSSNPGFQEILQTMQGSTRGLILVGNGANAEDVWAAAHTAEVLQWPLVADVGSRLHFGHSLHCTVSARFFDQVLLLEEVRDLLSVQVILQIGSHITSKRLSNFLLSSPLQLYAMVSAVDARLDPMHIVTHRVVMPPSMFMECMDLHDSQWDRLRKQREEFLEVVLSLCVEAERAINAWMEASDGKESTALTEMQVAHCIAKMLPRDASMFIGNSMPIRDFDMYAGNLSSSSLNPEGMDQLTETEGRTDSMVPESALGPAVGVSRGASGIDGIISAASGYAVGSNSPVTLVIGDVSFTYDCNGLMFLRDRPQQQPVVVVVINNGGGRIFDLLPVAGTVSRSTMKSFFHTPPEVDIRALADAYQLPYRRAGTSEDLKVSLRQAWLQKRHSIVEVVTNGDDGLRERRRLQQAITTALEDRVGIVPKSCDFVHRSHAMESTLPSPPSSLKIHCTIRPYHVELVAPLTSQAVKSESASRSGTSGGRAGFYFVLRIPECDNAEVIGEVAPLDGVHIEGMGAVESQLQMLAGYVDGQALDFRGLRVRNMSSWIRKQIGIDSNQLFPSVRCGLECALLSVLGCVHNMSLSEVLVSHQARVASRQDHHFPLVDRVEVNALCMEMSDDIDRVVEEAQRLVSEGYRVLKLKLARRSTPEEDAVVVLALREALDDAILLRGDANRRWTLEEAVRFGNAAGCCLEYIEEPVADWRDIRLFHRRTNVAVALDETLELLSASEIQAFMDSCVSQGEASTGPGGRMIAAFVLKPGVLGGFENTYQLAQLGRRYGAAPIISSAFETSVALSAFAHLALSLDVLMGSTVHGLGTWPWLHEPRSKISTVVNSNGMHIRLDPCGPMSSRGRRSDHEHFCLDVRTERYSYRVHGVHCGEDSTTVAVNDYPAFVFLHGFLGSCQDWIQIMEGLAQKHHCIALDLPGHGQSSAGANIECDVMSETHAEKPFGVQSMSEVVVRALDQLGMDPSKCVLVGYSMGGRLAIHTVCRAAKFAGVALVSTSAGLEDTEERQLREANDLRLARELRETGVEAFVAKWYELDLWKNLRARPWFSTMLANRISCNMHGKDSLARVLEEMSIGSGPSLWQEFMVTSMSHGGSLRTVVIVGEEDTKYVQIGRRLSQAAGCDLYQIPGTGHAVHLEEPQSIVSVLLHFGEQIQDEARAVD
mmetsp:Transcript_9649/g.35353  ORF Transcript_9649/g.35353 Transcript_9649/m.35353 type:complete len:2049 (+) Transcript_9649:190-6336(+)